jgi:pimeloyl-ACP methyl ester carboxylesterase
MEQLADDLAQLLDKLQVTQPVVFCGLSMGGYVAWQFFARHRARLAKLILCDTRAIADSPEAAKGRLTTADKVLKEGAQVVADAMLGKLFAPAADGGKPSYIETIRQVILRSSPEGIAAFLRGMAQRADMTSRLAAIDVPTLVICGANDVISPAAEMRGIAAAIPGAKFVEIANAGHMAPLEKPAEVNRAIREFLAT